MAATSKSTLLTSTLVAVVAALEAAEAEAEAERAAKLVREREREKNDLSMLTAQVSALDADARETAAGIAALVEKYAHNLNSPIYMDYNGTPRPW